MVCPEGDNIRKAYSEHNAPSSYEAYISLRQGLLRIPLQVKKSEGRFAISGEGRNMEINLDNLCFGGVCFNLPITPDGILFGKVIRGGEKLNCSFSEVSFEREEGPFRSKYIFKDGRLSFIEIYDSKKERALRLNYLDWSKEGYVKAIRLEGENLSFFLTVDGVKF